MKKNRIGLCVGLFILSVILLTGGGCVDVGSDEIASEDVTNQEPYSQFIGVKYKLKRGCYLAISSPGINSSSEYVKSRNEFINYCKQTGIKVAAESKSIHSIKRSDYYIVACGYNGAPAEFNEKYIGTEAWGGTIIALLPKGTEFIVRNITITYYVRTFNNLIIFTDPLVEIPSIKITANAHLLVNTCEPYTLVFEWRYVEMATPEPEKK